ncbi:hypothetical protein P168DRAFT_315717 [Aspergillus campestris IBT 28561]|uniref:Chitin-binding type-4 domain-containing protein n=1 Tax=Aspergillus campestris (strain IBT 28561) TaxID=1392248 RepID=A0A2I1DBF8_ASPC2|nr:uncharacterized protein P168DRAFT_315717 [Aspergillus campestris IBT 28561]PKY07203.1 hypothetical protein P168DRAFT_315717 [Aspergillus campestris IBT 28561]
MRAATAAAVLTLVTSVAGHGYMWSPESRTRQGFEAGKDSCPECTILEPVESWPNLDGAKVGRMGPCGFNQRDGLDYNKPTADWGGKPVKTYKPGEEIEVVWCLDNNGDHGGMFTYRVCQDQKIVDKLLKADYTPTEAEKQEAEDCFQKGVLKCSDVSGQDCPASDDCQEDSCKNTDWFTCNSFEDTGCMGVDNAQPGSCKTTISEGYTVTKKIKLPEFKSKHTLLSFKWNSFQTPQVYLNCADIAIQ